MVRLMDTLSCQVSAWKLRGNLPHAVESTWLLTEAILIDQKPVEQTASVFAVKAAYITAISRWVPFYMPHSPIVTDSSSFVTGLLDSHQESKYKVSMYAQAQKLGLPALFVDIRHEAAHGEMPNLINLRAAAERALRWLWDDYWVGLVEREVASVVGCVVGLRTGDEGEVGGDEEEEEQPGGWQRWRGRWTPKPIGLI